MSSPVPMFGTQDLSDDDGPVIDSLIKEVDAPPTIPLEPIIRPTAPPIPVITRVIADTLYIQTDTTPIMILPPDPNRREFQITARTPDGAATATDYVNVADESSKVSSAKQHFNGTGCYRIWPNTDLDLDAHTGAIYIGGSQNQTQRLEVTWRAVTS